MVSNLSFMLPIITKWFYIHTNTYYFIIRDHSDKSHEYKEHICTRYLIKNMVTPLLAESIAVSRDSSIGSNKELNHFVMQSACTISSNESQVGPYFTNSIVVLIRALQWPRFSHTQWFSSLFDLFRV